VKRCLIGHTGFVGGNLARQVGFDGFFNSKNIEAIAGTRWDLVVCAGAPAAKWIANREPEQDLATVRRLMAALDTARAASFVHISTVDVYPEPVGVDEDTAIPGESGQPYGRHRLMLERFVSERFGAVVLRLPGLFGDGIRKNAIHDLLKDHEVEKIPAEGVYQFYPLDRLWADIELVRARGVRLVNLATEPVAIREVARRCFGKELTGPGSPRYDMRTRHAVLWGRSGAYLLRRDEVLEQIEAFVARYAGGAA
jgi:nucleoside-diphosphate-sugar epimerase